jgi:hypothetical protein
LLSSIRALPFQFIDKADHKDGKDRSEGYFRHRQRIANVASHNCRRVAQVRSRKKPICPVFPTCLVSNEREQRKSSRVSGANRSDGGRQASVVGAIASGYCAMLISMPERRPKGAGMHGSERIYPEGSGGGSARSIMPLLLNEVPRDARQSLRVSLSISS